ncbi:hypothetical protein M885DRAFT_618523 [Pelagophyceae sp. CCMP2097]|nr:hypothetical protein M885DRAFT_618523 [Pelagophyceae sp. CCMP2097]
MAEMESSAAPAVLHLGVHELVDAMHAEHGLRNVGDAGDVEAYRTYRRYCVRRIRRARKALKLSCGKGKLFAKKDVTLELGETLTNAHLELALSLAERNWACSVELRLSSLQKLKKGAFADAADADADDVAAKKGSIARRARKRIAAASAEAQQLLTVCEGRADASTALEAKAYSLWLQGLSLELGGAVSAEAACDALKAARRIYADVAVSSKLPHEQDVFAKRKARCDAALRRCEYAMQLAGLRAAEDEEDDEAETVVAAKDGDAAVEWCGTQIPVTHDKLAERLRAAKLVGVAPSSLLAPASVDEDRSDALYSMRIAQLDDCVKAVGDESLRVCGAHAGGEKVEAQRRAFELLRARCAYEKLVFMARRAQGAVEAHEAAAWQRSTLKAVAMALSKGVYVAEAPDDVVHLYDQLLQIADEMSKLAGVSDAGDGDAELREHLECRTATLRALRCFYLAEVYGADGTEDGDAKAAALRRHTIALAERATLEAEACGDDATAVAMAKLADETRASRVRARAVKQLQALQAALAADADQRRPVDLADRAHAYAKHGADASPPFGIASLPPRPRPLAVKPLLFDIASNHMAYPKLEKDAAPEAGKRGGLFGWFRR